MTLTACSSSNDDIENIKSKNKNIAKNTNAIPPLPISMPFGLKIINNISVDIRVISVIGLGNGGETIEYKATLPNPLLTSGNVSISKRQVIFNNYEKYSFL